MITTFLSENPKSICKILYFRRKKNEQLETKLEQRARPPSPEPPFWGYNFHSRACPVSSTMASIGLNSGFKAELCLFAIVKSGRSTGDCSVPLEQAGFTAPHSVTSYGYPHAQVKNITSCIHNLTVNSPCCPRISRPFKSCVSRSQ